MNSWLRAMAHLLGWFALSVSCVLSLTALLTLASGECLWPVVDCPWTSAALQLCLGALLLGTGLLVLRDSTS